MEWPLWFVAGRVQFQIDNASFYISNLIYLLKSVLCFSLDLFLSILTFQGLWTRQQGWTYLSEEYIKLMHAYAQGVHKSIRQIEKSIKIATETGYYWNI